MAALRPQLLGLRLRRDRIGGMHGITWGTHGGGRFIAHGIDDVAGGQDGAGTGAHIDLRGTDLHLVHRDRGQQLRAVGEGAS